METVRTELLEPIVKSCWPGMVVKECVALANATPSDGSTPTAQQLHSDSEPFPEHAETPSRIAIVALKDCRIRVMLFSHTALVNRERLYAMLAPLEGEDTLAREERVEELLRLTMPGPYKLVELDLKGGMGVVMDGCLVHAGMHCGVVGRGVGGLTPISALLSLGSKIATGVG